MITNQLRSGAGPCLVCRPLHAARALQAQAEFCRFRVLKTQFAAFVLVYLASPSPALGAQPQSPAG